MFVPWLHLLYLMWRVNIRLVLFFWYNNTTCSFTTPLVYKTLLGSVKLCKFHFFFRLDFSVVELLDIFTPISEPKLSKPSTRRPETMSGKRSTLKTLKPVGKTCFSPARAYLQHTPQDQEESQILEDIFFICWQRRKKQQKTNDHKNRIQSHFFFFFFF